MFRRQVVMAAVLAVGGVFGWLAASGRMGEVFAQAPKTNSTSDGGTPKVLPRPDFEFKGKVGKTYKDSDPPQFPQPVKAPKGAPNVVLILLDDITSKSVRADASLPAGAGADEILAHFEQCTHRILRGMRSCAVEKLSSHG